MKITFYIFICFFIASSIALELSSYSSKKRRSEASAYRALTARLGYTNGYKELNSNLDSLTSICFDILYDGDNSLFEVQNKFSSYAQIDTYQLKDRIISSNHLPNFAKHVPEETRKIFQNNLMKKSDCQDLPECSKNQLDLSLDKIISLVSPSDEKLTFTYGVYLENKFQKIIFSLLVKNYSDSPAEKSRSQVDKHSMRRLKTLLISSLDEKKQERSQRISSTQANIVRLKEKINENVSHFEKKKTHEENQKNIESLRRELSEAKKEEAICNEDYLKKIREIDLNIVQANNELEQKNKEHKELVASTEVLIANLLALKEESKSWEIKKILFTEEAQKDVEKILYWLEASYYYRIFADKVVKNEHDIKEKFTISSKQLESNCNKIFNAFLPYKFELSFLKN